jgi:hypothetical protein
MTGDSVVPNEDSSSSVARAVWGVLMIWTGAVLLLNWGWGVGLVGAGAILLGAQALRAVLRLRVEGFGLVAGTLFVICGAGSLSRTAIALFPVLCIGAGIALFASAWAARIRRASGVRGDGQPASHPRP